MLCSSAWWRAMRQTCTSRSAPPAMRVHGAARALPGRPRPLARRHAPDALSHPVHGAAEAARDRAARSTSRTRSRASRASASTSTSSAAALGAAFRLIPADDQDARGARPPSAALHELAEKPRGLVLVTGPTGSGKSTTLAALIDRDQPQAAPSTSSRSRTRSSSCTATSAASSTSARSAPDATSFAEAPARRAAPGPRRDPRRRDARPRDDLDRAHRGRDRPPRVRDAAHPERAEHDRPRSSTSSRPSSRGRCACSSPSTLQGIVTQTLVPTADGRGRVPRSRSSFPTTRSGT